MKPSHSLSAQASTFAIGSLLRRRADHLGLHALGVDLLRDLRRSWRRGDRQDLMVVRVGIVVERALGRPFLGPGLEVGQLLERRQIVAGAGRHHLLGRGARREMPQQALGRRLVLAEVPDAPEVRQERCKASVRAGREAVRPALLGDLRRVALGDGPGARRVHDQRTVAGHQPLVVGAVVPGRRIRREEREPAAACIPAPGGPCRI